MVSPYVKLLSVFAAYANRSLPDSWSGGPRNTNVALRGPASVLSVRLPILITL